MSGMHDANRVDLAEVPGMYDAVDLIVDFCYGIPVQDNLDESNIAHMLCLLCFIASNVRRDKPGNDM